eukprot:jgi/Phyca11/505801/fgenesh2_kg.PHYCAscaffold_15_\
MFHLERPSDLARMLRALAVHSRDGDMPRAPIDRGTSSDLPLAMSSSAVHLSASMPSLSAFGK